MSKKINEYYFDKKQRTEEEKRAMYYILGAWYGSGSLKKSTYRKEDGSIITRKGVKFEHREEKLVQIVQKELRDKHKTQSAKDGDSYWFEASNIPTLCDRLDELGAAVPKKKRKFPDYIPKKYMCDFLRGFFDSQASIKLIGDANRIYYGFNKRFLTYQHKIFKKAGVKGGEIGDTFVEYGHDDSCVIYNILYEDWEFIEKPGLYLKEKHDLFNPDSQTGYWESPRGPPTPRVKKALKLIKKGKLVINIYKKFGYKSPNSLINAIKRVTGKGVLEYKRLARKSLSK